MPKFSYFARGNLWQRSDRYLRAAPAPRTRQPASAGWTLGCLRQQCSYLSISRSWTCLLPSQQSALGAVFLSAPSIVSATKLKFFRASTSLCLQEKPVSPAYRFRGWWSATKHASYELPTSCCALTPESSSKLHGYLVRHLPEACESRRARADC